MPTNLPCVSDAELIQQSRNGDESAYGQMVERYQSLVCSVAYSRCGDLGMSEDLAQEAFIQAWKKLADLSDANKFQSWICTIVRNLASRSREKSNRNVATGAARLDAVVEPASAGKEPIERVISAEQEQLVWQAIEDIPENYREPMVLFYREEQSVARVAAALDISQDAVKQRLSRGRKFLQEQLVATVETTLENSKPTKAFTGAVLLSLSGVKTKSAAAGVAATIAGKAAASTGFVGTVRAPLAGMFLAPLMALPVIAWLHKLSSEETRSSREVQLLKQHNIFELLIAIPTIILMFGSIFWDFQSPILNGVKIPAIMLLGSIPSYIRGHRLGKRLEQLRIEENTAAPLSPIVDEEQPGAATRLFLGSGLLVVISPVVMSIFSADWIDVGLLLASAVGISLTSARFRGNLPDKSLRVYATSLACISFVGIGVTGFHQFTSSGSGVERLISISWFTIAMMAMLMTQVVLSTIVWRRVYGKLR